MPYEREKVSAEGLGLALVAVSLDEEYDETEIPSPSQSRCSAEQFRRKPAAELPGALPDDFTDQYRSCKNACRKAVLDEKLDAYLRHAERCMNLCNWPHIPAAKREGTLDRLSGYWPDLIELSKLNRTIEQECLCTLLTCMRHADMDKGYLGNEIKLVRTCAIWILSLSPLAWNEQLPPVTVKLRTKIITTLCRRLLCRHLLGHFEEEHCHQLFGCFSEMKKVLDAPLSQANLRPITLRLAMGRLAKTLHVTMMYHDKQIIPLEPFLYHVVKSWTLHTGSSQDTAVAAAFNAEVRKAVSWCFILCTDASTKKAWLQDHLALEILCELATVSTSAMKVMQFVIASCLPDTSVRRELQDSELWLGEESLSTDPSVFYWKWQHAVGYVHGLQQICVMTDSPERRLLAFAGRSPGVREPLVRTDIRRRPSKDQTQDYGDGSLVGLAKCSSVGTNPHFVKQALCEAFEGIALCAQQDSATVPGSRTQRVEGLASAGPLLKPCLELVKQLGPEYSRRNAGLHADIAASPKRFHLTRDVDSSVLRMIADHLTKAELPSLVPWDVPQAEKTVAHHTPRSKELTSRKQPVGSAKIAEGKVGRKQAGQGHKVASPAVTQRKANKAKNVEAAAAAAKQPNRPGTKHSYAYPTVPQGKAKVHRDSCYERKQNAGLAALAEQQWKVRLPGLVTEIDLDLCDGEVTLAPPPSIESSSRTNTSAALSDLISSRTTTSSALSDSMSGRTTTSSAL
ncbi:uncharacterized protein LOC135808716 [Sycon ciliatum]|uniref:uncharacterized protein LOC135808716 n=1 Tax=Sycon ciliatum TaxID=27933 RepID=UPI0031F6D6BA